MTKKLFEEIGKESGAKLARQIKQESRSDLDKPLRQLLHELKHSSIGQMAFTSKDNDPDGPFCVVIAVTKEQAKALERKVMR